MSTDWYVAKSLEKLRDQINRMSPNRSKVSDGTIGDPSHQSRTSDHNPHVRDGDQGVVTGMDITNDPEHGVRSDKIAKSLLEERDARIKYIISNGHITSGRSGPQPWVTRIYTGRNPHDHHFHISVLPEKEQYNSTKMWKFDTNITPAQSNREKSEETTPLLKLGNTGQYVEKLQQLLIDNKYRVKVDSLFGPKTEESVKAFQKKFKLVVDGIVGAQTWEHLLKGK